MGRILPPGNVSCQLNLHTNNACMHASGTYDEAMPTLHNQLSTNRLSQYGGLLSGLRFQAHYFARPSGHPRGGARRLARTACTSRAREAKSKHMSAHARPYY